MKTVTIWQPWASLIAIGAKPYEFRGWRPPLKMVGSRIGIHAGARAVRLSEVCDLLDRLNSRGRDTPCLVSEIARPFLERVMKALPRRGATLFDDALLDETEKPFQLALSAIVCTVTLGEPKPGYECASEFGCSANDSDRNERFNWGWPMLRPEPLMPPIGARGAQGFWDWRDTRAQ